MGRTCSVDKCPNKESTRQSNKSFFKFPRDVHVCAQWVEFCTSAELTAAYETYGPHGIRELKICSDHFTPECFRMPQHKHRGLTIGAVPSLKVNLDAEYLGDPQLESITETDARSEMKKVEKRYYVRSKYDLFEVLILASPERSES